MSMKRAALITATTLTLTIGAVNSLTPRTVDQIDQRPAEQQVDNLSDSRDIQTARQRDAGDSHLDAELAQRNIPGEYSDIHSPVRPLRLP